MTNIRCFFNIFKKVGFIFLDNFHTFYYYTCHSKELYIRSNNKVIISKIINTDSINTGIKLIILIFNAKGISIKNSPS